MLLYPPTGLLLETVQDKLQIFQDKLQIFQDKLQILQYQNQLQQGKTDRLLEELATLKNTSMDGMILVFSYLDLWTGKHRNDPELKRKWKPEIYSLISPYPEVKSLIIP